MRAFSCLSHLANKRNTAHLNGSCVTGAGNLFKDSKHAKFKCHDKGKGWIPKHCGVCCCLRKGRSYQGLTCLGLQSGVCGCVLVCLALEHEVRFFFVR